MSRDKRGNTIYSEDEARTLAIGELVSKLVSNVKAGKNVNLNALVKQVGLKYKLKRIPKLVEIIAALPDEHRSELLPQLRAKPVRTASGVAIVALMSMPHRCPHIATTGNICVYCPGGPGMCCSLTRVGQASSLRAGSQLFGFGVNGVLLIPHIDIHVRRFGLRVLDSELYRLRADFDAGHPCSI